MKKDLSIDQLALLLELVRERRADVATGVVVYGGQDAQDEMLHELDALAELLNEPETDDDFVITIPVQRSLLQLV